MGRPSKLPRLDRRISASKRWGRIALAAVVLISLFFGAVLVQGLRLASDAGRVDLIGRAVLGLALLAGIDVIAVLLVRRQHVMLDEARADLEELMRGEHPH